MKSSKPVKKLMNKGMTHYYDSSYITHLINNREEAKNKAVMVRTRAEKDLQQVRVKPKGIRTRVNSI